MREKLPSPHDELSDEEIDRRAKAEGDISKEAMARFAGYLPAIAERRIHHASACLSVEQYAALFAGMTHAQVRETFDLERRFASTPELRRMLLTGEAGWSKLRVVASVATPETDALWADRVRELSKHALEGLVHDLRQQEGKKSRRKATAVRRRRRNDGRVEPKVEPESLDELAKPATSVRKPDLDILSAERLRRYFLEVRRKTGKILTLSHVVDSFLAGVGPDEAVVFPAVEVLHRNVSTGELTKRTAWGNVAVAEAEAASMYRIERTYDLVRERPEPAERVVTRSEKLPDGSRRERLVRTHIPRRIKEYLDFEYDGLCAHPGCNKTAEAYHHTVRYALAPRHDVATIKPVCRTHHVLFHEGHILNEEGPPETWVTTLEPRTPEQGRPGLEAVDGRYREHRRNFPRGRDQRDRQLDPGGVPSSQEEEGSGDGGRQRSSSAAGRDASRR